MRQFIAQTAPDSRGCLSVAGKEYRYLRQVLRIKSGDMVQVRLPDGTLQPMTAARIDESARIVILQIAGCCAGTAAAETAGGALITDALPQKTAGLDVAYWLFQFLARPAKMDMIIRQAVECGIQTIVPVTGDYTQAGSARTDAESAGRTERWNRIIREARGQSGSAVETRVLDAVAPEQAVALWKEQSLAAGGAASLGVLLYEQTSGTQLLHAACRSAGDVHLAALAVGCEGGISPREKDLFVSGGFVPVHFETNILRCETAALYGMAALQTALVEKKIWQ